VVDFCGPGRSTTSNTTQAATPLADNARHIPRVLHLLISLWKEIADASEAASNQSNGYLRQQGSHPENRLIYFEFRRLPCITPVVLLPSERLSVLSATPIIDLLWL